VGQIFLGAVWIPAFSSCFQFLHLLILVLLLLSVSDGTTGAVDDQHSEFIYNGFSMGNSLELTMDGQVSVIDGLLGLTSGRIGVTGHAFYPYPLDFTHCQEHERGSSSMASFSTAFLLGHGYPGHEGKPPFLSPPSD
jgi:hypothetical protein